MARSNLSFFRRSNLFQMRIAIFLACVAVFSLTEACTKKVDSVSDAGQAKIRVLRLGHNFDQSSVIHTAAMMYAKNVETASKGRLKIEIYPEQKLGTDNAMIEMARVGELDIIIPPTSKMSQVSPALQLLDFPFLFDDQISVEKILDGRVGKKLMESISDKGLVGLSLWQIGWKNFTSSFPINSPQDFQGKKIRVMRSPVIMEQFEMLGARAIPIDFYETYNALKDKKVDGQENPLLSIYHMKFYEVQSHLTLSKHALLVQMLVASGKTMASLPEDLREIIVSQAKEVTREQRRLAIAESEKILELLRKTPIKISEMSSNERATFKQKMLNLIYTFEDEVGSDIIKEAAEDVGISVPKDDSVIVAVDADLSGKSAISGQAIYRGVRLAADDINSQGGINGKKIRVLALDHEAVAARSLANLEKLKTRENVKAIFGGLQSAIILGEMEAIGELSKSGKIYIVSWATAETVVHNELKPNPIFRLSAHDKLTGPFLARQASKKSKKIALLLENSAWGRGNEVSMTTALKSLGLKAKAVEFFNVAEKEFVSHFKKIEDSGAEVIIMAANPAEAKEIVRTMVSRPKSLPIVAHWGFTGGTFGQDLSAELQSLDLKFLQTVSFLDNKRPQAKAVASKYLSFFGGDSVIDIDAAAGVARSYDAMRLVGLALKQNASHPGMDLIKAMESIPNFEGVVTSYKYPFKGQREAIDSSVYRLGRYDQKGRIIPMEAHK